jgi:hypothetical protein
LTPLDDPIRHATTVTRNSSCISGSTANRSDDDRRIVARELANGVAHLIQLTDRQIKTRRDVHQDSLSARQVDVFEQRAGYGHLGRSACAIFAASAPQSPIIAMPVSLITVRTSAKSTLMRPGRVISSAIAWNGTLQNTVG